MFIWQTLNREWLHANDDAENQVMKYSFKQAACKQTCRHMAKRSHGLVQHYFSKWLHSMAGLVLWPSVVVTGEGTWPVESNVFSLGTVLPTRSEEILFPSGWWGQDHGALDAVLVVIFSTTKKVVKHGEPGKEGGVEEGREGERAGRREGIPILSLVPNNSFSFL